MRSLSSGPVATLLIFAPLVAVPLVAVFGMPQFSNGPGAGQTDNLKFAADNPGSNPLPGAIPPPGSIAPPSAILGPGANSSPSSDLQTGGNDLLANVRIADPSASANSSHPGSDRRAETDPFADFNRSSNSRPASAAVAPNRNLSPVGRTQRWTNGETNGVPQKPFGELATADATADTTAASAADNTAAENTTALPEPGIPGEVPLTPPPGDHSKSKAATKMTERREPAAEASSPFRGSLADGRRETASGEPATRGDSGDPSPATSRGDSTGWKRAVGRLNALGIHDFELQPGERDGEFLFSCRFASRENPRVTHLFEGEAVEPLAAVDKVLRQIDEWRSRQKAHARRRTTAGDPNPRSASREQSEEAVSLSATSASER